MNRTVLSSLLLAISLILAWMVYDQIHSEMRYRDRVKAVDEMVKGRLDTLRIMQIAYRDMNGVFAGSFDDLFAFMQNGKYVKIRQIGNNDVDQSNVKTDSLFVNPMEEFFGSRNMDVKHFRKVPPDNLEDFTIKAGMITLNNVQVPVFEISDPHPFNKNHKALKIGDMYNAVTNGNWK